MIEKYRLNKLKVPNIKLPKEEDIGNTEYKREITNFEKIREKYLTQMIFRLNEGGGVAYYYIGVNDDGSFYNWDEETKLTSLKNLLDLIYLANAKIVYILEFNSGYKVKIKSEVLDEINHWSF